MKTKKYGINPKEKLKMTITSEEQKDNDRLPEDIDPSGYQATDDYWATQHTQGGRLHYAIAVPIQQLPVMLPIPDPKRELDDNRLVKESRAKDFAEYVRKNDTWHSGPLTIRTNSRVVKFEPHTGNAGPVRVGLLKVPRNNRDGFRIVDGQHRQLGFVILLNQVSEEIVSCRQKIHDAKKRGETKELIHNFENQLTNLEAIFVQYTGRQSTSKFCLIIAISNRAK